MAKLNVYTGKFLKIIMLVVLIMETVRNADSIPSIVQVVAIFQVILAASST